MEFNNDAIREVLIYTAQRRTKLGMYSPGDEALERLTNPEISHHALYLHQCGYVYGRTYGSNLGFDAETLSVKGHELVSYIADDDFGNEVWATMEMLELPVTLEVARWVSKFVTNARLRTIDPSTLDSNTS